MKSSVRKNSVHVYGLSACLVLTTLCVHANTFCVDTPATLRLALTAVSDGGVNNRENNTIKLVRGTYETDGAQFYFTSTDPHTLDINGGYNSDCTTLIENPELTILDGSGASRVFESESRLGDVSLRFLTFQNGLTAQGQDGGGLLMNEEGNHQGPAIVDQDIFRNNHANNNGGGFSISASGAGTIRFQNNLVFGNSARFGSGGGTLFDQGTGATIINNTITQNFAGNVPATSLGGLLIISVNSLNDTMSNSIVYGNVGYDLATTAVLVHNDCGPNLETADTNSSDNFVVDPKFLSASDFRLSADSPLLGMGLLNPVGGLPTIDIAGLPRQFNNLVDMGAYEYGNEIFKDGFDN